MQNKNSGALFYPEVEEKGYRPVFFKKSHLMNFDSQQTQVVLTQQLLEKVEVFPRINFNSIMSTEPWKRSRLRGFR